MRSAYFVLRTELYATFTFACQARSHRCEKWQAWIAPVTGFRRCSARRNGFREPIELNGSSDSRATSRGAGCVLRTSWNPTRSMPASRPRLVKTAPWPGLPLIVHRGKARSGNPICTSSSQPEPNVRAQARVTQPRLGRPRPWSERFPLGRKIKFSAHGVFGLTAFWRRG